ncbi:MAG: sugar ABC transporter permease [Acholeplasmatales bacterium]|nr:MAG: sugar ABC transporter permease [Acholeplasmatales bacterium]
MKVGRIELVASYVALCILSVVWLIPIVWVILTSFRGTPGVASPTFIPQVFTLDNYKNLFNPQGNQAFYIMFPRWFMNTLIIAVLNMLISTILILSTAYALSRFRFAGRRFILNIALVLGMFPGFMAMIAVYLILNMLGLVNSPWALLVVYSASSALGFYVSKGYFETVPKDLNESAMIDGADQLTIFIRIILPLSKPIVVYTALLAFMAPWMDFILASMILRTPEQKTVAVGLYGLIMEHADLFNNFTIFAAGSVVVAIPIVIMYVILQRFIIQGVAAGAIKG